MLRCERDENVETGTGGMASIVACVVWLMAVGVLILVILKLSAGFGLPQGAVMLRFWAILLALSFTGLRAIAGGVSTLKRRRWLLALIGSIGVILAG
jgi:hypothetical protein